MTDEIVDGAYGPITVTTMQVFLETQHWNPSQLRHEIVRLRLAEQEAKQEAKQEAWDEGYAKGHEDWTFIERDRTTNPYEIVKNPVSPPITCEGFKRNSIDALLTTPECEDYCATCGKHATAHKNWRSKP